MIQRIIRISIICIVRITMINIVDDLKQLN